jgi:RNA polymerase sigma-70 factor (ECF subfamily)
MRLQASTDLIAAAVNGGRRDVERLLEAVWPDIYRLAKAIAGLGPNAEDAAQDACVIVLRKITSLKQADAFGTWLYRIVLREALKHKRSRGASTMPERAGGYCEDRAELLDLWSALSALPDHLRTVIVLHYFEDLSSREIGAILGIPEATVRFRLMTARNRMQPLLEADEPSTPKGKGIYAV